MVLDLPSGRIARRDLITLDENASVLDAARSMANGNRGSILVTRGGDIVGILTERDILKKVVAKSVDPGSTKASEVMTSPLVTIDQDRPLREAIELMNRKHMRRMLVTEGGKIVGIFTIRDVLSHNRVCLYCGQEIKSILDSSEPDQYIECECGSRYHKKCAATVVNCVSCSKSLVTYVSYPEPSETFGG
ncbi:MAG TPA: CBS domain-containing protein [Nitrososphaerales archaeon]|nr:CBS domain-containing protein [Nitrososphaerales archaeon]